MRSSSASRSSLEVCDQLSKASRAGVALRGGFLTVSTPSGTPAAVRLSLNRWYRRRAEEVLPQRVAAWREWCLTRKLPEPTTRLRTMPKRWGSAAPDGVISLNPDLIRAPSACIDYVVAHEICHLAHPNHGPAFRRLLGVLCPPWEELKRRLERLD